MSFVGLLSRVSIVRFVEALNVVSAVSELNVCWYFDVAIDAAARARGLDIPPPRPLALTAGCGFFIGVRDISVVEGAGGDKIRLLRRRGSALSSIIRRDLRLSCRRPRLGRAVTGENDSGGGGGGGI